MAENDNNADENLPPGALRVLVVDNDRDLAMSITETLERVGYDCTLADSGPKGAKFIEQESFDIIVTDLMMNDVDGMEILKLAMEKQVACEVIMVTGHATVERAVEAMQRGAFTFLEKPIKTTRLRATAEKAADQVLLKRKNQELNERLDERFGFEQIIHTSDKMKAVIDRLKRVAPTDVSVLITGPTGSGKDLIAQAIHQNSPRKNKPYVAVNCGAISPHLVESELFGHVKGAFTDAHADRLGKFEYANGGTLFLDEIGDMPLETQIKLLRVLEERTITRVGDNKSIKVNVRVVSATNIDLEQKIADGKFRSDLYYRLKVVTVPLPPLNDRREDIIPLVNHFRRIFAHRYEKEITSVNSDVRNLLHAYDWQGNVRQLQHVIENMVVLDIDGVLGVDDLPPDMAENDIVSEATAAVDASLIGKSMKQIEAWAIEQTLQMCDGNREETARILDISPRTIFRKIKEYREEFPQYDL